MSTERPSPRYSGIDVWDPSDILDAIIEGQFAAVAAVRAVRPAIARAASAIEARLRDSGRLIYAGAGTSGRLAVQDGAELIPTFDWPPERLLLLMAGGNEALLKSIEGAEDEAEHAVRLVRKHNIHANDVVIAVAASGKTPFTLACLRESKERGALTVGIANNRDTPDPGRSGPSHLARYRLRADRRLDPHERWNVAADHPQPVVFPGHDPAGSRL